MLPGDVYYYSANSCVLCVKRGQLKKVQKTGTGLNPNADTFFYHKAVTPTVDKGWEPGEEFLTNGDIKQDEVGGGFSPGDSPVSDSPPAPMVEDGLDLGPPPQEFVPARSPPQEFVPARPPPQEFVPARPPPQEFVPARRPPQEFVPARPLPQEFVPARLPPQEFVPARSPPQEFVPAEPMVGTQDGITMVMGGEAPVVLVDEEGGVGADQVMVDVPLPQGDLVGPPPPPPAVSTASAPLANGYGPGPQDSQEAGALGTQVPETSVPTSPTEIRKLLLAQLEYYFSRVNLVQDHYLQSQMDGDQYVPISTIANFNQVVKLTRDYDLIVEILRSSKLVQVDETGTKVRPKHNRSVLMLREIPETTSKSEVEELFNSEHCPKLVSCEFAHNGYWYITFNTDEEARDAYVYLRQYEVKFKDKPVLARIKAKPLVRAGGSPQFPPSKNPSQQQQDPAVPFMRQQQPQYPVLTPMSQFVNQQQVQQTVQPFLYNFQTMMPGWGAPGSAPHTFLDPGAMLAMNGYQATSIKPSANHNRMFPVRNNNNRGPARSHNRPPSTGSDKNMDSRPGDRGHSNNSSANNTRASPRSNISQHSSDPHPPPFSRSRNDGTSSISNSANGHFNSQLHAAIAAAAPTPLVPEESLPPHHHVHVPAQPPVSNKVDSISAPPGQQKKHYSDSRRGNNFRRSRRNDDGAKNSRSNANHGGKDGKPHEPHFELEATSFPPLPGSTNNSSSSDAPEGNKLSDVVKGTARPHSRLEEKPKPALAPSGTPTASPLSAAASTPVAAPVSVADSTPTSQLTGSNTTMTAAAVVSAVGSPSMPKETEASSSPSAASHNAAPASATAVEPSAHPSKTSKTSSHSTASAAKPVVEATVAPKQATVSTAAAKQTPASNPMLAAPNPSAEPPKLSYAQMVARKQQAENAARQQSAEEGASSQASSSSSSAARSSAQTTLREQSQTQTSASVSASSAPPKSASASARPPAREPQRKDFDPKDQRFPGGRRAKENRDNRPRFDRRRSDRDVKVPAK
ncbi:la-related protein 4-like isoform X2 [Littorina saxatilis]|uniref:la-related protein 4-like isoform X2 n=1 Tax=Littorina saxatilis TaxID=31220 RepID=UPI0038B63D3B